MLLYSKDYVQSTPTEVFVFAKMAAAGVILVFTAIFYYVAHSQYFPA